MLGQSLRRYDLTESVHSSRNVVFESEGYDVQTSLGLRVHAGKLRLKSFCAPRVSMSQFRWRAWGMLILFAWMWTPGSD